MTTQLVLILLLSFSAITVISFSDDEARNYYRFLIAGATLILLWLTMTGYK
jgi:hypothetical protein